MSQLNLASDWSLGAHVHDRHHETIFIVNGGTTVETRGRIVGANSGSVLLYPRGTKHKERSTSGAPLSIICVAWSCGDRELSYELDECAPIVQDSRDRVRMLMFWLLDLAGRPESAQKGQIADILRLIVDEYHELGAGLPEAREFVIAIRKYVQSHLGTHIGLDDLSREACLSRFRFAHAFRSASGVSPMQFVGQIRAETARTLLVNTNMPQKEIAAAVGLRDTIHLSRLIRRYFHCAPGHFRAEQR